MKDQKSRTEGFFIGSFLYTNNIVKTKINFPLFKAKRSCFLLFPMLFFSDEI